MKNDVSDPDREVAIEPQCRPLRDLRASERHVLVVRLVGRGATEQEGVARVIVLRDVVRIVVVHLVIVPGDPPRKRRMRGLEIRIGPILRVAVAVVLERRDLVAAVHANPPGFGIARVLIDVVAEVKDEVEIFGGEMTVGREVAGLEMLTGDEGEPETIGRRAERRQGPRASDRARRIAHVEPIPVPPIGPQPFDVHVHRVRPLRRRAHDAASNDLRHLVVFGDFPPDVHRNRRHAAALQRIGRQPCPQNDAGRRRIARRDAQLERRKRAKGRRRPRPGAAEQSRRQPAERQSAGQQRASAELDPKPVVDRFPGRHGGDYIPPL